jgi:SET domain
MFRIEQVSDPNIGLGVFANCLIPKGTVIIKEECLCGVQHAANKLAVSSCAHCFKYFNANEQLVRLSSVLDMNFSQPTGDKESTGDSHCVCGEHYCSESCRIKAYESYHWGLCVATESDDSDLVKFKMHAMEIEGCGDTLLLAAQLICKLISIGQQDTANPQQRLHQLILELIETYTGGKFTDIARPPNNDSEDDENSSTASADVGAFKLWLKEQLEMSYILFIRGVNHKHPLFSYINEIFGFELFDRILGLFERNNIDIDLSEINPLQNYKNHKIVNKFMRQIWNEDDMAGNYNAVSSQEISREFPVFHGIGFYPIISRLNHQCNYNARIDFDGNIAHCIAVKDIQVNEEIRISYIGNIDNISTSDIILWLSDYGFTCTCLLCSC